MFDVERELRARRAAFTWLDVKLATGQSELSRAELESFEFEGEPLKLIDQSRGIRNPRQFAATLSVMTGANSPYADEPVTGGLIRYDYRTGGGGDNVKLRRAAELRMPVIYFRSIRSRLSSPPIPSTSPTCRRNAACCSSSARSWRCSATAHR